MTEGRESPAVEVWAAGGVIRRGAGDDEQVAVVHRPKYDDWSFPKGKVDPGESWAQAAVREVFEEADVVAVLGVELPAVSYRDHKGRSKVVRYWEMSVAVELPFRADDEIDEIRWLDRDGARRLLSYDHDRALLDALPRDRGERPETS